MNICIPVEDDAGLDSRVCEHFGSAPLFMIVDTATGLCRTVPNANMHHGHGMCQPLASLSGEALDGIVVGGIGMGAVAKLQAARIEVLLARHATVRETVEAYRAGTLRAVTPATACGQHGAGHGHGHGQGGGPGGGTCGHGGGRQAGAGNR